MATDRLSLPVDIPWKRLCVSEDMIDKDVCNREFPYRWRSSVSVFSYEPPKEHQEHEGTIVSYLKVVCTVTGYQPDPEEVGIKDRRVDSYWTDPDLTKSYKKTVSKYYGCYGAILEVAVAPGGLQIVDPQESWTLDQWPYFADFEPKRREIYELVSETGDRMSRSLENVNVRKGTTTTESHEVMDIFGGFGSSGQGGGGGGSWNIQGQWGTRDLTQEEHTNVRTTDRAREERESFSHTTQLTQMYHQLTSYHLGTNRAVFYMLPRPHIVQSENTFVNGPRLLEGIQEFFLVVMRPEDMEDICVEAYLETAHIYDTPIDKYEKKTDEQPLEVTAECIDKGRKKRDTSLNKVRKTERYVPPPGWEIDLERNGGYTIRVHRADSYGDDHKAQYGVQKVERDHIIFYGEVQSKHIDRFGRARDHCKEGKLEITATVYLRRKEKEVTGYTRNLWLTGRGVCCGCPAINLTPPEVVWEGELGTLSPEVRDAIATGFVESSDDLPSEVSRAPVGGEGRMSIQEANQIREAIGRTMISNRANGYPRGAMRFTDTQFIGETIAQVLRENDDHPDNQSITDIKGLDPNICHKIAQHEPGLSRAGLLEMPLAELRDRFELSNEKAQHVHRAALGLEGPLPDPRHRWDQPGYTGDIERVVPLIVGLPLDEARDVVTDAKLRIGEPTYRDSEQPRDTVLDQHPDEGENVPANIRIDLVLSTGLNVHIPDVVGQPLSQALCMLRDAGLEAEPEIDFVVSNEQLPRNYVLDITPQQRTYITPQADVRLKVSSGTQVKQGP